ncbi:AAC-rich mRNA clone AAC11 protein-like [Cloeon dipterum]|uniref:AAC-rich mRNA clone AAC11 protein-like n=1 Tax=Cloeon dipterum TaxID=197152 RepID=UPI0032209AE7
MKGNIVFILLLTQMTVMAVKKRNMTKHTTSGLAKHNLMQPLKGRKVSQGQQIAPQVKRARQGNMPNGGPLLGSPPGQGGLPMGQGNDQISPQGQGNNQNFPLGQQGNGQGFNQANFPQGNNQNNPQGQGNGQGFNQGNFPLNNNQNFPQGNFPQGQGNGQGNFPQGQGNGQGIPQGQGNGQNFPQGQGNNQGFPQGGGQGSPPGQGNVPPGQNPSYYYEGDYYYYDDTSTTVNDAASFSKRQEQTPPVTAVPLPVSPSNPSSLKPRKRKNKNKQGRNPLRRRRPAGLLGNGFENPFKPHIKVSMRQVQVLPVRRPGWRNRRRKANADKNKNNNGTLTANNQTISGQAGGRGKKNGRNNKNNNQRNKKNRQNGNRNKRKRKKKGTKKPTVPTTAAPNAIVTAATNIPFVNSRRPRMTTPAPEDYYYEYYDNQNSIDAKSSNVISTMSQSWTTASGAMSTWTTATGSTASGNSSPSSASSGSTSRESEALNFCQTQNFDDAIYCCSLPAASLFNSYDMDECLADLDPDNEPPSIDEYTINKGLIGQGDIDFNNNEMKNLTDAICLSHCTLISLGFLSDQPSSLDFEKLTSYMQKNLEDDEEMSPWVPVFQEAAKNCTSYIQEKMGTIQDRINDVDSTCFTKPYLFIQCVQQAFLMNCPKPSDQATREICTSTISGMKMCNPFD